LLGVVGHQVIGCKYSVIRNHRGKDGDCWDKIIVSGLTWEAAQVKERELQTAEMAEHPEQTCWVRDIFWILLEGSDRHKDLLAAIAQGKLFE
jgi:hypothetical protein